MKLGVISNCQNVSLSRSLLALRPDDDVVNFGYQYIPSPHKRAAALEVLRSCDIVFSADCRTDVGELTLDALQESCKLVVPVPPIVFNGFHPDAVTVLPATVKEQQKRRAMWGPTGELQSRLAIVGFLAGLSVEETLGLYGRLAYSRLGYFDRYGQMRAVMLGRWTTYDIDLAPFIDRWVQRGSFMHTHNHPKHYVIFDIAEMLCQRLGIATARAAAEDIEDDLQFFPTHPVYPDVADVLGLPQEEPRGFRPKREPGTPPTDISLPDFVAGSFASFANSPRPALMRMEGVKESLRALGLLEQALMMRELLAGRAAVAAA